MRIGYFLSWFFWSGITHATLERDALPRPARTVGGVPLYVMRRFVGGVIGALAAIARGNMSAGVDRAIDAAFAAGYAAARWRIVAVDQPRIAQPV
jgi:hypothetical protein